MRHEELREALGRHVEGELAGAERRDVERHLAVCAACRAEAYALRATLELLRALPDPEPPADLVPGVMRRLESDAAAPRGDLVAGLRAIVRGAATSLPMAALAASLALLVLASLERDRSPIPGATGAPAVAAARPAREGVARRPAAPATTPLLPGEPAPRTREESYALAPAPEAPAGPSGVIDADALETEALDPAHSPRRSLRPGTSGGIGAAAARESAGTGLPPRPALAACDPGEAAPAGVAAEPCRPWLQGMLTLAQYDPRGFLAELESLPPSEAVAWLTQLARLSRETRTAEGVASRLRATPDARIVGLARWFEPAPVEPLR